MIMNPFTLERARNQVRTLNSSVGYKKIGGGGGSKFINMASLRVRGGPSPNRNSIIVTVPPRQQVSPSTLQVIVTPLV